MIDFKKSAMANVRGCALMEGVKLNTNEILNEELTIDKFDFINIKGKKVAVVTFVEKPNAYYMGGMLLTRMFEGFVEDNGGVYDEELVKNISNYGLGIKLHTARTTNGNNVTLVDIL